MSDCSCCDCVVIDNTRGSRSRPGAYGTIDASWCNTAREFLAIQQWEFADDAGGPVSLVPGNSWADIAGGISGGQLTLSGICANAFAIAPTGAQGDGSELTITAWGHGFVASREQLATAFAGVVTRISLDDERLAAPQIVGITTPPGIIWVYRHPVAEDSWLVTCTIGAGRYIAPAGFLYTEPRKPVGVVLTGGAVSRRHYANAAVSVSGNTLELFRDGESVWSATRPGLGASLSVTDEDGEYLIVSTLADDLGPHKDFASFVVDRDLPVIGATPPNDVWADENLAPNHTGFASATKPMELQNASLWSSWINADESDAAGSAMSTNSVLFDEYTGVSAFTPGTYTAIPRTRLNGVLTTSVVRDFAKNHPLQVPQFDVRVHAVPANNRRGARPRLENVAFQTRPYGRPRKSSEPVSQVRLVFDRKVTADAVDASQLTLTCDGVAVSGCTMTQLSDTEWVVNVPTDGQDSKTFWVLTYDPDGVVMTDDIQTIEYRLRSLFPQTGQYKTVYVSMETGVRYSWSPSGYIVLGESEPPKDANGVAYEPEPCVLATRTSWLMASFNGWLQPKNVDYTPRLIGDIASVSETVEGLVDNGEFGLATTSSMAISNFGQSRLGVDTDGFWPGVPTPSTPQEDCSYWGLKTTIDPCPPKVLSCPAPRAPQRHSSAILSNDEITAISVQVVRFDENNNEIPAPGYAGAPINCNATAFGGTLGQNVWGASTSISGQSGWLTISASRSAYEFLALRTTTLGPLNFQVTSRDGPTNTSWSNWFFALTKSEEASLAAGNIVYSPPFSIANELRFRLQRQ